MSIPPPAELAELIADLERDTGVAPMVEEIRGAERRWLITMRNERVRMTITAKAAKRGRYTQVHSTLEIDGQPRPVADDYRHFVRIFNDPDETPPKGEIPPPPEPCDPDRPLPPTVAVYYRSLTERIPPERITLGRDRDDYVIDLRSENGSSFLRIAFLRPKRNKPPDEMGLMLIIEGRDRSREVKGDLEAALALLGKQATPNTGPGEPTAGQESTAGQGFGSVGVRRHSVIRN